MNHLNVVSGSLISNPLTTWLSVRLGRDGLEDVLDVRPRCLVSSWHDRWSVTGTLLTSRNTGTDKVDALLGEILGTAGGVWVMRVTSINDDIALLEVWEESLNEVVDWLSGHDEEHDAAWGLELSTELLDGVSTLNGLSCGDYQSHSLTLSRLVLLTLSFILEEVVDLGNGTVESDNVESVVGSVEDQVLSHDSETDEAEISTRVARSLADIDASKTCAKVSKSIKSTQISPSRA